MDNLFINLGPTIGCSHPFIIRGTPHLVIMEFTGVPPNIFIMFPPYVI
nr:MAG TPA: hypothetical protein [Caudoviricetes sp.]